MVEYIISVNGFELSVDFFTESLYLVVDGNKFVVFSGFWNFRNLASPPLVLLVHEVLMPVDLRSAQLCDLCLSLPFITKER